jgi:hypothetical protein
MTDEKEPLCDLRVHVVIDNNKYESFQPILRALVWLSCLQGKLAKFEYFEFPRDSNVRQSHRWVRSILG